MEEILSNPLYATLAVSVIVGIIGFRFVGPIIDRITAAAREKQKMVDSIENLSTDLHTLTTDFEDHEKGCNEWKASYGRKIDKVEETGDKNNNLLSQIFDKLNK